MALPQQNTILHSVNLNNDINRLRQENDADLFEQIDYLHHQNQHHLDQCFNITISRITSGYALYKNALARTGRRTLRPALRRSPEFQSLSNQRKDEIIRENKYIRDIVDGWHEIISNCTRSHMINVDIRTWPLWKLAAARSEKFVDEENNKSRKRCCKRPVKRAYEISMVDNVISNQPGSTDQLIQLVNGSSEQLDLISKDFKTLLYRRSNELIDNETMNQQQ